jgi:hypothetical protein
MVLKQIWNREMLYNGPVKKQAYRLSHILPFVMTVDFFS